MKEIVEFAKTEPYIFLWIVFWICFFTYASIYAITDVFN